MMNINMWSRLWQAFDPLFKFRDIARIEYIYVPREVPIASSLAQQIETIGRDAKAVLTGQRGSGKSTELGKVFQILDEKYFVVWLDAETTMDLFNVNHLEILIGATAAMYKTAKDKGIELDEGPLNRIANSLNRVIQRRVKDIEFSAPKLIQMIGVSFRFGLSSETVKEIDVEPEVSEILGYIEEAIEEVNNKTGYLPLWIIDGLDRIDELNIAQRIFAESRLLAKPSCPIIYTIPFELFHSPHFQRVRFHFSVTREIPNLTLFDRESGKFSPNNFPKSYNFLKEIAHRRLSWANTPDLIDEQALELLIEGCGGVIREFIYLVQYALGEAQSQDKVRVDITDAERAIERTRREKIKGLREEAIKVLCRIYQEKPDILPSIDIKESLLSELIQNLYILYYEDGGQWYWIHPILKEFLNEKCKK